MGIDTRHWWLIIREYYRNNGTISIIKRGLIKIKKNKKMS